VENLDITSPNALGAESLKKSYKGREVVKTVGLGLNAGEIVGLLGPNGAGKTTTFYMMVGLVQPDAGNVYMNGKNVTEYPMFERARIGLSYLPQEPSVFRKLTVEENIRAVVEILPKYRSKPKAQKERVTQLIEELALSNVARSKAFSLSGGERRRVEIARALACSPKFMLLDEPFAGIDPIVVGDLQDLVRELQRREIGVLITDHNVRETLGICDRAYILSEGKILDSGTPEEIANSDLARRYYLVEDFEMSFSGKDSSPA